MKTAPKVRATHILLVLAAIVVLGILIVAFYIHAPYRELVVNTRGIDLSLLRQKFKGDSFYNNQRFEHASYYEEQLMHFWKYGELIDFWSDGRTRFTATRDPLPAELGTILFIDQSNELAEDILSEMCWSCRERIPRSIEDANTIAFVWEGKRATSEVYLVPKGGVMKYSHSRAVASLRILFVDARTGENRGMLALQYAETTHDRAITKPSDVFTILQQFDTTEKAIFGSARASGEPKAWALGFPIRNRTWKMEAKPSMNGSVTDFHFRGDAYAGGSVTFESQNADSVVLELGAFDPLDQILIILTDDYHNEFIQKPRVAAQKQEALAVQSEARAVQSALAQAEAAKQAAKRDQAIQRSKEFAAAEAEVNALVSVEELRDAAIRHPHWRGRVVAINRISDRVLIRQIAENESATAVRQAAVERLNRLIPTEIRSWTHRDGRQITGRILSVDREKNSVTLEVGNVRFDNFLVEQFSFKDQQAIAQLEP